MVDSGWFDMNCEESKLGLPAFREKLVGDVVTVRRIYSGGKNPDKFDMETIADANIRDRSETDFTQMPHFCYLFCYS